MELVKLKDRIFYINNFTNIGVIKGETGLILIDTGLEKRTAQNILELLEKEGMEIKTILNTHSHADHSGGNHFLKKTTNAQIIVPEGESSIIEEPLLEPYMFYSGAAPIDRLMNKFLMATPTLVDKKINKKTRELKVDGLKIGIVPLPGHSINQVGYVVDQVLFCGDSFFSVEVLDKYKIPFFTDIGSQIETLNMLGETKYHIYLPSHSTSPLSDINYLVEANLKRIRETADLILDVLVKDLTTEEVISEIFDYYKIKLIDIQQYYLSHTSILAYLSYLFNQKKIKTDIKNNLLCWKKAD